MVRAFGVRRNSSAAICLPSISSVNFLCDRIGIVAGQTPDAAALARRGYFGIGVASHIEEILRPDVDRVRVRMSAVIQIDRGERIRFGEHVRDAVGLPGLHRRQSGRVVAPGVGILGAGMALRIAAPDTAASASGRCPAASTATPPIAAARPTAPKPAAALSDRPDAW